MLTWPVRHRSITYHALYAKSVLASVQLVQKRSYSISSKSEKNNVNLEKGLNLRMFGVQHLLALVPLASQPRGALSLGLRTSLSIFSTAAFLEAINASSC